MAADKPALELGLDFPFDAMLHFRLGDLKFLVSQSRFKS